MGELSFSAGAAVEVNIDQENSCDIWFPATVVKQIGNGSFLVEYKSLNEPGFFRVVVDSLHIRPPPPSFSNRDFQLLEKVDAFYGFGWSSGVVTKVLADGRYIVFFKRTRKEKELSHADLRLHMEWMDGKWIHPSQEHLGCGNAGVDNGKITVAPESSDVGKENVGEERISSPVFKNDQKEQIVACTEKLPADFMTTSNKRIKQIGRNNATKGTPSRKANGETAPHASLSLDACLLEIPQTGSSNSETGADSLTSTVGQSGTASAEKLEEANKLLAKSMTHGTKKVAAEGNKYDSPEREKSVGTRKRGRPPRPVVKTPEVAVADGPAANYVVGKGGIEELPKLQPAKEVIIGLTCFREGKISKGESPRPLSKEDTVMVLQDEKSQPDIKANQETTGSKQQKDSESSTPKRKRGRPPKLQDSSPRATVAGKEQNSAGGDANQIDGRHSTANVTELPTVKAAEPVGISDSMPSESGRQKLVKLIEEQTKPWGVGQRQNTTRTVRRLGKKSRKILNETFGMVIVEQARQHVPRKHQRRKISVEFFSPNQDSEDIPGMKATQIPANGLVQDAEPSFARTSSTVSDDDRPLSSWLEGAQSSPKIDDARGPGFAVTQLNEVKANQGKVKTSAIDQCNGANANQEKSTVPSVNRGQERAGGRADKIVIGSDATVPQDRMLPDLSQNLPFSKTSLIWKMIESMEVFQAMPQRPHFRPLYDCKEECREGLAIGNMVTFATLADKVSKIQFDDPKSTLDSNMEILADLEKQGFDVEVLRGRLGALLSIKGGNEQAEKSVKEIGNQIGDRTREKSRIKEEIEEIDKKMMELKERRRVAVALEEQMGSEILRLQSSVNDTKKSMQDWRTEFERLAAAPW
ncbi:hypothetical protein Ancab_020372 [Ancistrocladus abbreviatus]